MEKKLEIKHRIKKYEILKEKKKQLYIAKKAELEARKMNPIPYIKVSDTAQQVLKNIKSIKNKNLIKKLKENVSLGGLKGKTRYNFLKEIKTKLYEEELEKKKKEQENFFIEMNKKKDMEKNVIKKSSFGLLRF